MIDDQTLGRIAELEAKLQLKQTEIEKLKRAIRWYIANEGSVFNAALFVNKYDEPVDIAMAQYILELTNEET